MSEDTSSRGHGVGLRWAGRPRAFDLVGPEELTDAKSPGWRLVRAALVHAAQEGATDETAGEALISLARNVDDVHIAAEGFPRNMMADAQSHFVCEDETGDWMVSGDIMAIEGRATITSITVQVNPIKRTPNGPELRTSPPPSGLTTAAMRSVSPSRILEAVRREILDAPLLSETRMFIASKTSSVPFPQHDQDWSAALSRTFDGAAPPTSGYPDSFYAEVALAYLAEQGQGRGIYGRLAHRLQHLRSDRQAVPPETLRTWIKVAEERGFLTSGTRGRSDRSPGPRLLSPTTEVPE